MATGSRNNAMPRSDAPDLALVTVGSNTDPVKVSGKGKSGKRQRSGGKGKGFGGGGSRPSSGSASTPKNSVNLSTTERNDPLWGQGSNPEIYVPIPDPCYIYPGAEVLPVLTSVLHSAAVSLSNGYSRRVPECAFSYFVGVVTWYRMLWLERANGFPLSASENQFVESVSDLRIEVPRVLAHFLSGFGNLRLSTGREVLFRLLSGRNYQRAGSSVGWFGRVGEDTQPHYQSYPCLAVYACRILESMRGGVAEWQFPEEIEPEGLEGGLGPSRAMLGFGGGKEPLSQEQIRFLYGASLRAGEFEQFPSCNQRLPLCNALVTAVMNELRAVNGFSLDPIPMTLTGSSAQLAYTTIDNELEQRGEYAACSHSFVQLPLEVSSCAKSFTYRVVHALDDLDGAVVAPWCVWRYERDFYVDWYPIVAAGNRCRALEFNFLNEEHFRTSAYFVRALLVVYEMSCRSGGH